MVDVLENEADHAHNCDDQGPEREGSDVVPEVKLLAFHDECNEQTSSFNSLKLSGKLCGHWKRCYFYGSTIFEKSLIG